MNKRDTVRATPPRMVSVADETKAELARLRRVIADLERGYREIGHDDIGKARIEAFGYHWLVAEFAGYLDERDVGKRVYRRGDHLQIENDQQRNERIRRALV